jgi:L-lactate dehydrogenase (cytochrome)/(S)-mandelate dehydrogenase
LFPPKHRGLILEAVRLERIVTRRNALPQPALLTSCKDGPSVPFRERQLPKNFDFRLRSRPAPITVEDHRDLARKALTAMVWAYVDGGAEDETTLARNRAAFAECRLRQKVLAGYAAPRLEVEIAGMPLKFPVLLAPTGGTALVHWQGELAAARAAEAAGTRLVLSAAASYAVEEIRDGTAEKHWFQLYPWGNRDFIEALLDRVAAAGMRVLFVTVDVPTHGGRESAQRRGMGGKPVMTPATLAEAAFKWRWWRDFLRHKRMGVPNLTQIGADGVARVAVAEPGFMRADLAWSDLEWIRARWRGPLFIKGILDPDDAARALDLGAEGIVVSNHGGRQLDGAAATLDALPAIAQRVGKRAQILLDGGVRRGSDVVKAICLGADACLIGRPFLYGLAAGGQAGVTDILRILKTEMARTMTLMGCGDVAELDRSWLFAAERIAAKEEVPHGY